MNKMIKCIKCSKMILSVFIRLASRQSLNQYLSLEVRLAIRMVLVKELLE